MTAADDPILALKLEGTAHLKSGDIAKARDAYSKALALDPEHKHAEAHILFSNRALTHLKLSSPSLAKEDCTAALKLNPYYGKALFRRAQASEALKALGDAFKDVRELLRLEPTNKEAQALAGSLKRAIEERTAKSDLSTPTQAVEALASATSDADRVQAAGKLSRIAEDESRGPELLHAGAVDALVKLLPAAADVPDAKAIKMPLVGLAVEALDRIGLSNNAAVLKAIGGDKAAAAAAAAAAEEAEEADGGVVDITESLAASQMDSTADRVLAIVKAATDAKAVFGDAANGADAEGNGSDPVKNLQICARRGLSLVATLAGSKAACGSQLAQGGLVKGILPYLHHADESMSRAAQDALVRVVAADLGAVGSVLPDVFKDIIWLLGDEESPSHRVALGVLMKLMGKQEKPKDGEEAKPGEKKDKAQVPLEVLRRLKAKMDGTDKEEKKKKQIEEDEEAARVKFLCGICESVLSPILRSDSSSWEEHVHAVHGVTAVLEVNKEVGAWLLRQESIFWSLAEVAEMEDEDLAKSLAEVYAHAANDPQHFREKQGDEPIKHLKQMLKSPKPRVRCRACVALAKVCLLHHDHRVDINPNNKVLTATLGLLEAKVPASVHRWAVEALMFLTMMPDTKAHLIEKGTAFGSMVALAESVKEDVTLHFSLINAFRRLCVARDKTDEEKRLLQEMDTAQIEQMRQMASGGLGAPPSEKEDDPEHLRQLAYRLVKDDACLVVAEIIAHTKSDSMNLPAAQVLLAMAGTPEARGKMVQQGGFKAMLTLTVCDNAEAATCAAWGLAKIGISINPALYPRRTGSGPEAMVVPLVKLIDDGESELQQFEAAMTLCNLATVPELRERIVKAKAWRALEMALTSDNELVQRASVECLSNLVQEEEIAEKFLSPTSTATKIFVGFAGSDDLKTQIAATGGLATIAGVPEIGESLVKANVLEPLVEICLIGEEPAVIHRAAVALSRLLESALDAVVGPEGGPVPDHAMLALGALSSLASSSRVGPARKAAVEAIDELGRARPEIRLPPPELVAQAVEKLQAEAEARAAAAEEEERIAKEEAEKQKAEEEYAKDRRKAKEEARRVSTQEKLDSVAEGKEGVVVEEGDDDDDDDDDALEVI